MISVKALRAIMPRAPEVWLIELANQMPRFGIDKPNEIASFVAQLAHESMEFNRLEENLSYSAQRLQVVWPSRFKDLSWTKGYAHHSERLANYVYANRMGNGPEASGDGWKFRGRGPIMLTGRANYRAAASGTGFALEVHPEYLLTPTIGIAVAGWYWKARGLDLLDDDRDVRAETRAVQGGVLGLSERQAYLDRALVALTGQLPPALATRSATA